MKHPPRSLPLAARRLLTAIVVATAGWGATATATTNKTDCDSYTSRAETFESPLAAFSLNAVDHVTIDGETAAIDDLENDQESSERAAPFLYLTPRVASVLRDIFDLASDEQSVESDTQEDAASSPLAEIENQPNSTEFGYEALPEAAAEDEHDLPLLQRQMFRTDI